MAKTKISSIDYLVNIRRLLSLTESLIRNVSFSDLGVDLEQDLEHTICWTLLEICQVCDNLPDEEVEGPTHIVCLLQDLVTWSSRYDPSSKPCFHQITLMVESMLQNRVKKQ